MGVYILQTTEVRAYNSLTTEKRKKKKKERGTLVETNRFSKPHPSLPWHRFSPLPCPAPHCSPQPSTDETRMNCCGWRRSIVI